MAQCRSCGARIIWALTPAGRRMPIDAAPADGGNVILHMPREPGAEPTCTVVGKHSQPALFGDDGPRHTSHFATCPNADRHRQGAPRRNPPPG